MNKLSLEDVEKLIEYRTNFPLYAEEILKIRTKVGENVPFKLNRMQKKVWSHSILPKLEAQKPIRLYALKARQEGFSTLTEGLGYWVESLNPFRHGLVVSYDEDSATSIFTMMDRFYIYTPTRFKPMRKRSNKKELFFANPRNTAKSLEERGPGLQSSIRVATAKNKNMGVSSTLQFVHLSEFSRFEDVNSDIENSMIALHQTVAEAPFTFIIIETTAKGLNYAKTVWDDDEGYEKLFISYVASDEYTSDIPLEMEQLSSLNESEWGNEVKYVPIIRSELKFWYPELKGCQDEHLDYEILRRLSWRRDKIKNSFKMNTDQFKEEYPVYPEEAFLTSGDNVFNQDQIEILSTAIESAKPSFHRFKWDSHNKDLIAHNQGPIKIKEFPQKGAIYSLGADVTAGENDPAAISILKLPYLEQVVSGSFLIDPDDFAYPINYLARRYNRALVGIEVNGAGVATQNNLAKNLGYKKFYRRVVLDHVSKKYTDKLGWYSDGRSKPYMVEVFRGLLRDKGIIIWDNDVLKEALSYVYLSAVKMGALGKKHDDLLVATMISVQVAEQLAKGMKTTNDEKKIIPGSFAWYNNLISVSESSNDQSALWSQDENDRAKNIAVHNFRVN